MWSGPLWRRCWSWWPQAFCVADLASWRAEGRCWRGEALSVGRCGWASHRWGVYSDLTRIRTSVVIFSPISCNSPFSSGLCCICDYAWRSVAGAQLCHIPVTRFGPSVSPAGNTNTRWGCVLTALCLLHATCYPWGRTWRESTNCSRKRNLPSHQQANEGCG